VVVGPDPLVVVLMPGERIQDESLHNLAQHHCFDSKLNQNTAFCRFSAFHKFEMLSASLCCSLLYAFRSCSTEVTVEVDIRAFAVLSLVTLQPV